eukprot:Skav209429  [mRNA]  locus=scaffold805:100482:102260:- [translate_table: standard]
MSSTVSGWQNLGQTSGLMAEVEAILDEGKKDPSEGTLVPSIPEGKLAIAHGNVLDCDGLKLGEALGPPQLRLLPISGSIFQGVFEEKEGLDLVEMLLRAEARKQPKVFCQTNLVEIKAGPVASADIRLAPDFEKKVQEGAYFRYINNRCEDKQRNFFEALRTELKKHIMNSCIEMCLLQPLAYDRHASVLEHALEASTAEASVAETCASDIEITTGADFGATPTPSCVTMETPVLMLEDSGGRLHVEVKSYGILGISSRGKEVEPPDEITVLVDPAGLLFIQEKGPAGAGGAAGANYKWLEINEDQSFPTAVKEAITEECQAKFHSYANGMKKCIHVVGPDFRTSDDTFTEDDAVDKLAIAYRNVFEEFCSACTQHGLRNMRLLPISGGIFSGRFKQDLPEMTARAVHAAYEQLSENEKKQMKNSNIEMCIFMESELKEFQSAFGSFQQEAFVAEDSRVESSTSMTCQVPCRVMEAGTALVACGRHVSALLLAYWLLLRWL